MGGVFVQTVLFIYLTESSQFTVEKENMNFNTRVNQNKCKERKECCTRDGSLMLLRRFTRKESAGTVVSYSYWQ